MREGLRSRSKLLGTVPATEENNCSSTNANAEKFVAYPKRALIDQRDGSNSICDDEGSAGCDVVGKEEPVECSHMNGKSKRSRIDGKSKSEDDNCGKMEKLKESDKSQVFSRVLRSMSTAKSLVNEDNERERSNGGCFEVKTRGEVGSEKELEKVEMQKNDCFSGEHSCHVDNNVDAKPMLRRGRPRKIQEAGEFQKKLVTIEKGEIGESADQKTHEVDHKPTEEIKPKHEGPPMSQESGENQKILFGVEKEEIEEPVGQESHKIELVCLENYLVNNKPCEEIKRRRGRPPKSQGNDKSQKKLRVVGKIEIGRAADQKSNLPKRKVGKKVKRKLGRPRKVEQSDEFEKKLGNVKMDSISFSTCQAKHRPKAEFIKLKPRRGRPPKVQKTNLSEEAWDMPAGVSGQPDNEIRQKLNHNLEKPCVSMISKRKKVGVGKKKNREKILKHNAHVVNHGLGKNSSLITQRFQNGEDNVRLSPAMTNKKKNLRKKKSERQAVRDKIVELLLGAGWTVQYRPRFGREYMDAVYVNPQGNTHWSVTLAYRVLKKQYENGDGDSNMHDSGFRFTPIPDEELQILTKVITKKRSDKNKKKKKKKWNEEAEDEDEDEEETCATKWVKWNQHKRKLGAAADIHHEMLKGRKKLKTAQNEQDETTATSGEGTAVSVRDRKRRETHGRKPCSLIVRKSQDGSESDKDGYLLYNGKRTVLSWMIDLGTVPLYGKVHYLKGRKTRAIMKGCITKNGIHCDCCGKNFSIAEFETHAGGKSCQPLGNIYLEAGSSLLQCLMDSWHKEDESVLKGFHFVDIDGEDPNDDTCGICGDGGNLICCDSCPSTFHQSCLEIRKFPSGLWHCIYCSCKFCGKYGGNKHQSEDDKDTLSSGLFTCHFCEEKYHQSCVQEDIVSANPDDRSFCGKKCHKLHGKLQMLFGVKHDLEEGFSWTFVRRFDVGSDISLSGMSWKVECNSKVAVAMQIMDECFLPMIDHRSGVNLIRNIMYSFGSNFNRLNYSGFITAILERGDEMVAVASIRIHGNRLAEMPFIGTRYMYRRQGMCRRLLTAIEMALCFLNVEKLVIPAVSELMDTWTSAFGFKPLEGVDKQLLRNMNIMMFPGVDMLQKPLLKHQSTGESMHLMDGSTPTEFEEFHATEEMKSSIDGICTAGFDLKDSSETGASHSGNIMNELTAAQSGLILDGCLNYSPDHSKSSEILNHRDLQTRTMDPPYSLCNARDQTGFEILDNSNKGFSAEFNMKGISAPRASLKPVTVGSGVLFSDGCLNDTSNRGCCDQSDETKAVFMASEQIGDERINDLAVSSVADCVVHITAEVSSSQSQEVFPKRVAKFLDLNAAPCKSMTRNIFCDVAHPLKVATSSCRVSTSGICDLNEPITDQSTTSEDSDSDRTHTSSKLLKPPCSASEVDHAIAIQSNSELTCSSSSAPGVTLHCSSGGGKSCGASEVMILSNKAN